MRRFRHELRLFFVALQFLTRLPVPGWVGYEPDWLNRAVRHFPLVGAVIGMAGALVALLARQAWPPAVAAALAVGSMLWLTVAFHEDGLADTCDALLGAAPREKALAIMKDSRIGTYGAAALAMSLLLRVLLLADLLARDPRLAALALVASHACGRACAVGLMALLPYAGDEAHAKARPLARHVRGSDALCGIAVGAVALGIASSCAASAATAFALAASGLIAICLAFRAWLMRRLGGYTGDTLGACEQLGEIAVMMALAVVWPR